MVIHPIEVDRNALWNVIFAVIISVNVLLALVKLFAINRYIKEDTFRYLFRRKRAERKNEEKRNRENDGEES